MARPVNRRVEERAQYLYQLKVEKPRRFRGILVRRHIAQRSMWPDRIVFFGPIFSDRLHLRHGMK